MTHTIHRTDRDGVAVLTLDHPGRSTNIVDEGLLADLQALLESVWADDSVQGVVVTSAKDAGFGVGADVEWLPQLAARDDAGDYLANVHGLMLRMARSAVPIVTAIHGAAFGGALELALAGHVIVAAPDSSLGLPEVTLSLLPGGGGTQLLRRWVAAEDAVDLLVTGRRIPAEIALGLGLVDEVVDRTKLLDRAVSLARSGTYTRPAQPEVDVEAAIAALEARRQATDRSRRVGATGQRILAVVEAGVRNGMDAGLEAEREAFLDLLRSPESRAALHLFQAERAVRRHSREGGERVEWLGVVGGGQMGSGIAATAVTHGTSVVVHDVSQDSLDRASSYRDRVLERTASGDGPDDRADRWAATTQIEDLTGVDAVIEAVFEDPELKARVLGELVAQVGDDTLVATNTSAISIANLADHVPGPERFLGMHFFSPVDRMPLVELVPHAGTSRATLARAASLGRQLGKVPVVVGDAPGFFTSRVYARWLMEGIRLLLDGVDPGQVDHVARTTGFPAGPLLAHDQATLELVVQASITQVADNVMTDRLDVAEVRQALESLTEAGVRGRRHGEGFYTYDEDGRRAGPNPRVREILGVSATDVDEATVASRLLLSFVTECFLAWDDGTLCHPDDGDVASVLGIGFPRPLGGPFHWVDELGCARIVEMVEDLDPDAFPLGETVPKLAREGGTFAAERRREVPFS